MRFMKKETEEAIEEICKSVNVRKYVFRKVFLFFIFAVIPFRAAFFYFTDTENWLNILRGSVLIILSIWMYIENFVEIVKFDKVVRENEKNLQK